MEDKSDVPFLLISSRLNVPRLRSANSASRTRSYARDMIGWSHYARSRPRRDFEIPNARSVLNSALKMTARQKTHITSIILPTTPTLTLPHLLIPILLHRPSSPRALRLLRAPPRRSLTLTTSLSSPRRARVRIRLPFSGASGRNTARHRCCRSKRARGAILFVLLGGVKCHDLVTGDTPGCDVGAERVADDAESLSTVVIVLVLSSGARRSTPASILEISEPFCALGGMKLARQS